MGTQAGDNLRAFKLGGTVPPLPAPRTPGTTPVPPIVPVAQPVLATYVGTYELQPNRNLIVTIDNGKLIIQVGGPIKVEMCPTSDTTFLTVTPNFR